MAGFGSWILNLTLIFLFALSVLVFRSDVTDTDQDRINRDTYFEKNEPSIKKLIEISPEQLNRL